MKASSIISGSFKRDKKSSTKEKQAENKDLDKTIANKKKYPSVRNFMLWNELGIDPQDVDKKFIPPTYKCNALYDSKVFCYKKEKFVIIIGQTKEDKDNNIKSG